MFSECHPVSCCLKVHFCVRSVEPPGSEHGVLETIARLFTPPKHDRLGSTDEVPGRKDSEENVDFRQLALNGENMNFRELARKEMRQAPKLQKQKGRRDESTIENRQTDPQVGEDEKKRRISMMNQARERDIERKWATDPSSYPGPGLPFEPVIRSSNISQSRSVATSSAERGADNSLRTTRQVTYGGHSEAAKASDRSYQARLTQEPTGSKFARPYRGNGNLNESQLRQQDEISAVSGRAVSRPDPSCQVTRMFLQSILP
jgi:hypothetical protein